MAAQKPDYVVTDRDGYILTGDDDRIITGYQNLDLELLFGVIVEPNGARDWEGQLVELVAPAWWLLEELLQAEPDALFKLGDRKFEELLAGKYDLQGYIVKLTPRAGDNGVDVVAESKDGPRVRIFDQAKRYSRGKVVPANDVRALMGTWAFSDATQGVVTTTSEFAPRIGEDPYIQKAIKEGLKLINGTTLLQQLAELRAQKKG